MNISGVNRSNNNLLSSDVDNIFPSGYNCNEQGRGLPLYEVTQIMTPSLLLT